MSGRRVKRLGETNSALVNQLLASIVALEAKIDELFGVGTDNKDWYPCIREADSADGLTLSVNTIRNAGATDGSVSFKLTTPLLKGTWKFNIDRLKIEIFDADDVAAGDKITSVQVYGTDFDSVDTKLNDATERVAQGSYEYDITDFDASVYAEIRVRLNFTVTTANDLDMTGVDLRGWWAQ